MHIEEYIDEEDIVDIDDITEPFDPAGSTSDEDLDDDSLFEDNVEFD